MTIAENMTVPCALLLVLLSRWATKAQIPLYPSCYHKKTRFSMAPISFNNWIPHCFPLLFPKLLPYHHIKCVYLWTLFARFNMLFELTLTQRQGVFEVLQLQLPKAGILGEAANPVHVLPVHIYWTLLPALQNKKNSLSGLWNLTEIGPGMLTFNKKGKWRLSGLGNLNFSDTTWLKLSSLYCVRNHEIMDSLLMSDNMV